MRGVVFFGVPHDGMNIESLVAMVGNGRNRALVESLSQINSQILTDLRRRFENALGPEGQTEVFCFYETEESPTNQKVDPSCVSAMFLLAYYRRPRWDLATR